MEELEPEEQFLQFARNGDLPGIQRLLMSKIREETQININCRGKKKSNLGWTPLHLACYFGHKDVVEELLKAGADVNLPNNIGDTPLHKAAFTGRKEVVMLLLHYDACATVINGTAQIPKDVTQNPEIRGMLEAAERTEERKLEEELLEAAREGNLSTLTQLLSRKKPPDINCTDLLGNTPLHSAAYRGQKQCALKLLKSGANPNIKNKNDQTVFDLASDTAMKQVLESNIHLGMTRYVKKYEGFLLKSSRFFGWRSYWVVLQDGVLSWYSKQSDAAGNVRRQGCKSLTNAQCLIRAKDSSFFTLKCFDDSVHHFKVSPKSDPEATRKAWLDALEEHSAYSTHYCSQEQGSEEEEEEEVVSLGELTDSLQAAEASQKKLEEEVAAFLYMLKHDGLAERFPSAIVQKMQEIYQLSSETSSSLSICLSFFSKQEGVRSLKLEQEVEKNKILSEALQTLATEHHELEQSVVKGSSPRSALSEDEFHDAVSESDSEVSLSGFETVASQSFDEDEEEDEGSIMLSSPCSSPTSMLQEDHHGDKDEAQPNGITKHRTSLPAPMFSRNDFSIWSILRNCIGMELSKITMPVIFNEPLSFLQRLTEYMEHTYLIHQANTTSDSIERMKCVAAFAVSAVASQWERTGKPFNPLLGETYELVRDDLGFRLISEQVSHHPPVSAFHAEGLKQDFVFHGSIYPKLKFWGKSVEAEPKGIITLELPKHNEAYTWTNPTCCVHNIIVGQLWIEQYGNMELINHRTGEKCCLNFKPCGLFGKELHKVEGYILDKSKKKLCALYGKWTECMYVVDPAAFEAHKKNDKKAAEERKGSKAGCSEDEVPSPAADTVEMIPGSQLLWRIAPRPANSTQMYSFTSFAMQLNELRKEMEGAIPQTDCRLRPDIRAMENGDIDLASEEKKRLEEKQRAARKNRSKSDEEWKTRGKTPTLTRRTGSFLVDTGTGNTASCQTFTNGHFPRTEETFCTVQCPQCDSPTAPELSKITMPVIFNEPLSFLQRLTEYMEHTYLIHQANTTSDSIERMKCVAAFAVSAVASQWERTGKPFNPLLGETYELVRDDLGFRLISEQVSHHPPVSAFHAEGLKQDFVFHGSIYPKLKFWGKSVEAEPKGIITLELPKHNEAYTWTNPTCCVHNIIVGQLWIEQYGNMELINHRTGEKCCLNFKPCGLFGKELHKVEGYILDKSKKKLCALYGKWTECMYVVDPAAFEAHKKNDKKAAEERKGSKAGCSEDEVPSPAADTVEMIPGSQLLWRIAPRPANSTQMYSFTSFAMQLNELRKEMEGAIPQTDCRLRPDIRAMENGDIDLASEEKKRLEEKQRAARKNRSKSDEEWKTRSPALGPRWFQQGQNPHTNSQDWLFSGGYWDRKYSQLPDIY